MNSFTIFNQFSEADNVQAAANILASDPASASETQCKFVFSVITPTYNRAKTLHRVYDSLRQQTYKNFEWIIVDDGSMDNTEDIVNAWKAEAPFQITFHAQKNQGKHIALNRAVEMATGMFFLNFDSDDGCKPDALQRFLEHWMSIEPARRDEFAGVCLLAEDQHGKLVGNKFPIDPLDSNPIELRYKYHVFGDKWGIQKMSVMREFPFPESLVGTLVPENIVWDAIGRKYKTRFANDAVRIYYIESDNNSLVHSKGRQKRNARGWRQSHLTELNNNMGYFVVAPVAFAKTALFYARTSFHAKIGLVRQHADLENETARLLWFLAVLPASIIWLNDIRTKA